MYERTKKEKKLLSEKRVENIIDKIDELVVNSCEETVFVYQVGINNLVKSRSKEVYEKYKDMIRKINDCHRRSVVCGLMLVYSSLIEC